MRELFLVPDESSATSLVLRSDDGEQFFLDVTTLDLAATRALLTAEVPEPESAAADSSETSDAPPAAVEPSAEADRERVLPTPDPLLTAPLTMRPREIQGRVRAGSSVEDLAAEMGVAPARVEPFAHPVLLERERMAELAKQAHPVREDGPAKLTLWEVLAAAFAARGNSVTDTTWDAFREADGTWVVRVSWTAGLSENEAEWSIHGHMSSQSTAEARNAVAADLTDPDFVQPVRTLSSVGRGSRGDATDDAADTAEIDVVPEEIEGDDFLQHPDPEEKGPTRRRRKAVTPHWEDVLLGVRTNTKRPRN
ncbi:septation protein SepH [Corynebacterium sp.]|uniref:septation protein SepH n=1 Tax=Corynebacterium sp. TaxID=1720 RepID=UPI0026DFF920|nr:septation protein SepH [Corynebacterium sp.]MDO5512446.1 septation protein SepH [Corynebacterium sp.]